MTIALFTDSYLPTKSGIVTVVIQLREQLIKMGHRVLLICPETTPEFATSDPDFYRVKSVPDTVFGTDQFGTLPNKKDICKFIKKNNVDILHCHTEFSIAKACLYAAKKLKIPAICTTHTMWIDFYKYYRFTKMLPGKAVEKYMNNLYKKFDALINVSQKARNYYKKPKMIPKMPSVIIPNAIDTKKFEGIHISEQEKHELRTKYGVQDDEVLFLFLGRIAQEKRVFELSEQCVKLVENNPKTKVMFVGKGPAYDDLTKKLENQIKSKKIIFAGYVDWSKTHEFYEAADVFITASLSEMHSMTILEAQLCSLPIVARNDESYVDCVIPNVNGYLANSDDELYENMIEMANNEQKRKLYAKNAFEQTKNFSLEENVKKTVFVYEEVIKSYPKKIDENDVSKRMEKI